MPSISLSQEWLLGEPKEVVINALKEDCNIVAINNSSIEFSCGEDKSRQWTCSFKEGLCVKIINTCNLSEKNYFVNRYVESEYNINVKKETVNGHTITWIYFKNALYNITILSSKETDFYMITTSYL